MTTPQKMPNGYAPTADDLKEGVPVNVDESTEKWSTIKLEDGAIFRVKANVIHAIRLKDKVDQDGNPIYAININPVISLQKKQ